MPKVTLKRSANVIDRVERIESGDIFVINRNMGVRVLHVLLYGDRFIISIPETGTVWDTEHQLRTVGDMIDAIVEEYSCDVNAIEYHRVYDVDIEYKV